MQSVRSGGASLVLCAAFVLACSSSTEKQRPTVPSSDREILALKPAGTNALIVHAIGFGTGTVTISDPSQTCVSYEWGETAIHYSQVCWAYVPIANSGVAVTAAADAGSEFTGWGAPCAGSTESTCAVPMDADRIINIGFWPKPPGPKTEHVLNVHVLGFVDGEISAPPGVGLVCQRFDNSEDVASLRYARTCTAQVPDTTPPTEVTLTATPTVPGTQFAGWGGGCGGIGTCKVTMDRDAVITASFVRTAALAAVVDVDRADPTTASVAEILNVAQPAGGLTIPGQAIGVVPGRNLLLGLDPSGRVVHLAVLFGPSWSFSELGVRTTVRALFLSALAGVVEDARGAELASSWLGDQPEFPEALGAAAALIASRGYLDASAPEATTLGDLLTSVTQRLAQSVLSDGPLASSSAALGVASTTGLQPGRSPLLMASSAALTSTLGYLLPKGIRIDWAPRSGSCTSGDMTFQNPNPHFTKIELSTEFGPLALPSKGYTLIAPYEVVPDASVSGLVSFVHSWLDGALAGNLGFEATTVAIEVPPSARTLDVAAVDTDVRSILANVIVDAVRGTSFSVTGELLDTLVEGALLLGDVERASRQFEADRDVAQFVRAVARPTAMYVASQADQWLTSAFDRFLTGQPLAMIGAQVGILKSAFYTAILASDLSTDSRAALSASALFGLACAAGAHPALSVTPASGPKGTSYAAVGTGFTPAGGVEVYLQRPDGAVLATSVTGDSQGSFRWSYDSTAADQYGQFRCWAVDVASGQTSNFVTFEILSNATWTTVASPTGSSLYGVRGDSANRVWAVGGGSGVILGWDGTAWTALRTSSAPYYAIWGLTPGDFWVFSTYRQAYKCDLATATCTNESFPGYWASWYLNDLVAAWGDGPADVWAVDTYGYAIHWDGTTWVQVGAELNYRWWQNSYGTWFRDRWPLYGIWGSSPSSVWAVGYSGAIVHWDGLAWSDTSRPTSSHLHGIWGSSATDVWAVGTGGTILHWDGSAWASVASETTSDLMAVWGNSPTDVWAVGANGTATHWDGAQWRSATIGPAVTLRSVWGSSSSDMWAVGDNGTILHYH